MWGCKTFIIAQIVHHRAQRVVPKWFPNKRPVLACGSGRRDRAATGFWVLANGRSASSSFPHQAARVLWCCRRSHLALPAGDRSDSGLSARNVSRRSWVARQHFPHNSLSADIIVNTAAEEATVTVPDTRRCPTALGARTQSIGIPADCAIAEPPTARSARPASRSTRRPAPPAATPR